MLARVHLSPELATTYDIFPTIAELANAPLDAEALEGGQLAQSEKLAQYAEESPTKVVLLPEKCIPN